MQKSVQHSLIATAIAAALGFAGTAAAETTVYGKIHVSAGSLSSEETTDVKTSATTIASHASRLGFKASKKLENGMSVIGQLEYEIDTVGDKTKTSTEDLFKARNTYVGLKGGFGEVRVGIHDTPHKMSTAKLDPLADTYADYNSVVITDARASNVIAYLNKFGDLSVALAYSAGDEKTTAGENKNSVTSAMIAYEAGPLYLTAAVENYADKTSGTEASNKFGAGYKFGPVTLGLVYDVEVNKNAKDDIATYGSLQWKVTDAGTIKAAYGKLDYGNTATKDRTFSAVAYDHKLDKDANVYVLYASGKDGGLTKGGLKGDATAAVVGMEFKF